MKGEISDRDFADRIIGRLPQGTPPPGFEAALLAAYDAWADARPKGWGAAWKAGFVRFADLVWPGAPRWAPGAILAAALLAGAGLGTILPAAAEDGASAFSLEQPAAFSLSSDQPQEDF
jgi:hypothetical protein